ncbi:type IV inositol polyphosphate 5-phosphatase 3 isoform X3 [Brachypodium distachyon]|uniref:Inositol polyphosphate-related phosphatase domain-containing protein n=1 Tax=Brachypodium distachyon TaxID=15368 RepID=A0A0Q3IB28_BRADI|nr:type IV inositol polyphosphate 5-phosphatase 3 isoform X3 [Brachypodium distachyon]KQK03059.1 hypothetical protein BRADI_2g05270v3 [Brachypodium distachyon]|eukprot:XP_010230552.1 type IV inositol polyphosphate 5-phosphatase 3 isoform X3 [Brachypodium distachyon]
MVEAEKQRKPGAQAFWPKVVLKKWLNLRSKDAKFDADEEDDLDDGDQAEDNCGCDGDGGVEAPDEESRPAAPYRLRRRNSETMRAQYIDTRELRIFVGTFNAAGVPPPPCSGPDIAEWLDIDTAGGGELADVYVLGFQEVVPLNAGNVFGAEDAGPAMAWEELIRDTLTQAGPRPRPRYRSQPATPARSFDAAELLFHGVAGNDTEDEEEEEEFGFPVLRAEEEDYVAVTPRKVGAMADDPEDGDREEQRQRALVKTLSKTDRIGLAWPEPPLDLLAKQHALATADDPAAMADPEDRDLGNCDKTKKTKGGGRSPFVRIVSKQMVGIFLTVWVRRELRKCVHNLKVSTVGVGAMGYIGNKGAVSASMSIYQTMFCFVCTHLSAGERPADLLKRNADVHEIHRRTRFSASNAAGPGLELPREIHDHERIFWLGDLNYRIEVPYERAHGLVAAMDWARLAEKDQLKRELRKGRAFDGWAEGVLEFAPTYKYEIGPPAPARGKKKGRSRYIGDDGKGGRRTPAWCDRVLSYGKGIRLLRYARAEMAMSDHRPVAATYGAEVEVFCGRKLQRALTLTKAEVERGEAVVVVPPPPPPDLDF